MSGNAVTAPRQTYHTKIEFVPVVATDDVAIVVPRRYS